MSSVLKATIHAPIFNPDGADTPRDIVVVWHKHMPLGDGVFSEDSGYTIESRTCKAAEVLDRAYHAGAALRVATRIATELWEKADEACKAWVIKIKTPPS
jgi:hypothetical protein